MDVASRKAREGVLGLVHIGMASNQNGWNGRYYGWAYAPCVNGWLADARPRDRRQPRGMHTHACKIVCA